ncbi:MAG: hypothetical protein AAF465_15800 [Pseudomonadota bacterium]
MALLFLLAIVCAALYAMWARWCCRALNVRDDVFAILGFMVIGLVTGLLISEAWRAWLAAPPIQIDDPNSLVRLVVAAFVSTFASLTWLKLLGRRTRGPR